MKQEPEVVANEVKPEEVTTMLPAPAKAGSKKIRAFPKKRGVGITRKNRSQSKKARKTAKNSRRRNRGK